MQAMVLKTQAVAYGKELVKVQKDSGQTDSENKNRIKILGVF